MQQSSYSYDLNQLETIVATPMTFDAYSGVTPTCGGFTYELEYMSGPLIALGIDHMSVYALSDSGSAVTITGTPVSKSWLGEHMMRLKCTNGFSSAYSNSFQVKIVDACERSIVNSGS